MESSMKVSRRKFLGLFGATTVAAVVPMPAVATAVMEEIPVEYGFTWYGGDPSLSEIISKTIDTHKHLISENICMNNPLLLRLQGHDDKVLRVVKISEEEQVRRMKFRLEERLEQRRQARLKSLKERGRDFSNPCTDPKDNEIWR